MEEDAIIGMRVIGTRWEVKMEIVPRNDLIVIKQLPVIEDRLDEAYESVKERLDMMSTLVVTEENYKDLKKVRADLNKEFTELESLRKRVKAALEEPYKAFEGGAYKRLADAYKGAVNKLDGDIKDVEGGLKEMRQRELLSYYTDYRKSIGLDEDIADPRKSGIKVGLTGTMKALKEQAKAFLDKVDGDLKMIDTLENRDEVLAEYRMSLSVTDAVRIVADRKKRIEEERVRREAESEEKQAREEHDAQVEAAVAEELSAPTVQEVEEPKVEVYTAQYLGYEVQGTMEQLRGLKVHLQEAIIEYCEKEGMSYGN